MMDSEQRADKIIATVKNIHPELEARRTIAIALDKLLQSDRNRILAAVHRVVCIGYCGRGTWGLEVGGTGCKSVFTCDDTGDYPSVSNCPLIAEIRKELEG